MKITRRLSIAILSVLMVFAVGMAVACSTKDSSTSSSTGGGTEITAVNGKFYFEDSDDSMVIYLELKDDNTYTITVGSTKDSGKYELDQSSLKLKVGDNVKYEASYNNDNVTVRIGDRQYTLIVDIDFTVTFVGVDQGVFGSYSTIKNGKKLELPTPEKDGFRFVAWYTDSTYSKLFSLTTAITGNITLYARFVPLGAEEYIVRFHDGDSLTELKTSDKQLATLPTNASEDFVGWWVSETGNASELTRQLESGVDLYEDTEVYAVYGKDGLHVSVSADGKITWNELANHANTMYTVKIDGQTETMRRGGATSLTHDFGDQPGKHTVEVSANGKFGTAVYTNKRLLRPSMLKTQDFEFSFGAVENATSYTLRVEGAGYGFDVDLGGVTAYDFSACEMSAQGITFTVTAKADGYVSSTNSLTVVYNLDAVEDITYDKETRQVKWSAVEFATEYLLKITDADGKTEEHTVEGTSFDVSHLFGSFTVSVTPVAKGYNSPEATVVDLSKNDLASPTGMVYSTDSAGTEDYLTWNPVAGATGYTIEVVYIGTDGKALSNTRTTEAAAGATTKFKLPANLFGLAGDSVAYIEFRLTAKAADAANNSAAAAYRIRNNNTNVATLAEADFSYDEGVLSWMPVRQVPSYKVTLPDGTTKTTSSTSAEVSFNKAGKNTVTLEYSDGYFKNTTATCSIEAYAIIFQTGGSVVNTQYKAVGDIVVLPDGENAPVKVGYDFAAWFNGEDTTSATRYGASFKLAQAATTYVYAGWTPKDYNVTLDAGEFGEKLSDDKSTVTVTYKQSNTIFPVPAVGNDKSKLFYGWYSEPNGQGQRFADQYGVMTQGYNMPYESTMYAYFVTAFEFDTHKVDSKTGAVDTYSVRKGPEIDMFEGETVTIPSTYNGKRVDLIETFAFGECTFRVVEIPNTIYTIQLLTGSLGSAFSKCRKLEAINVYEAYVPGALAGEIRYFSDDGVLYFNNDDYVDNPDECEKTELAFVPMAKTGTIYIPEGVEIIPMGSLGNYDGEVTYTAARKFDKVVIPHTVTTIQEQAFVSNSKLTEITFLDTPDGSVGADLTIGTSAMASCTKLTTINFPARLKTFDVAILEGSTGISAVNFASGNANYVSKDGVVFSANMKKLIYFPCGREATEENPEAGKYTTPDGVETIGSNAFSGSKLTEITIGKDVTTIEPYAFSGVKDEDGKSATGKLEGNFKGRFCENLEKINFIDGDLPLTIGEGAFGNFIDMKSGNVTEITLPRNLAKLGEYAFVGRTNIKTVTINLDPTFKGMLGSVIDYAENAFAYSTTGSIPRVEVLNLGEKVPVIDTLSAMFGSKNLKEINVGNNPNYSVGYVEGTDIQQVLYDSNKTKILYFFDAVEDDYVLPETVTEIPAGTFRQKNGLTGITIHSGVKYIGNEAFKNCGSLVRVTILDSTDGSVTELNLGNDVFSGCDELIEVTLPTRMRTAGSGLFKGCELLEHVVIPEGVTELGDETFSNVYAWSTSDENMLKTVSFPSTLKKFGTYETDANGVETLVSLDAFRGCNYLEEITVAEGNTNFFTDGGILYNNVKVANGDDETTAHQLIICPVAKTGVANVIANVTKVWPNAFKNNAETTEIIFAPATMENYSLEIGDNAFAGCKKLTKISLPEGLKEILPFTFKDCTSLKEVVIPSTVAKIHGYAYVNLTSMYGAFYNCENLESLKFAPTPEGQAPVALEIGDGHTTRGEHGEPVYYSIFIGCPKLTVIEFPERTVRIGDYAFYGNNYIKEVSLPSTLTELGISVFESAKGLDKITFATKDGKTSLKEISESAFSSLNITGITLPEGIVTIGAKAFYNCYNLTSIDIPSTVKTIGDEPTGYAVTGAFYGCTNLAEVTFAENTQLEEIFKYTFGKTALTEIKIPATVKTIGEKAFENVKLTKVEFLTVGEGDNKTSALTSIGANAFAGTLLTSFTLPETNAKLTLGKNLFSGCTDLEEVYLSSQVASITNVFDGCKSDYIISVSKDNTNLQTHETLPLIISKQTVGEGEEAKTVITIKLAYRQITEAELIIPDNCIAIEANAFALQQYITKVVLPAGLTTIGDGAFHDCHVLKEVEFKYEKNQNQLTTLGTTTNSYGVFQNCYSLEKIVLPNAKSATDKPVNGGIIYDKTFLGCVSITKLGVTPATEEDIKNLDTGVYIPSGTTSIGTTTGKTYSGYGSVFQKCTSLESVTLPANLKQLSDGTFAECSSLTTITYVGAPVDENNKPTENALSDKITTVGSYAFYRCTSLQTLSLSTNTNYKALGYKMFAESGLTEINIPKNVTALGLKTGYGSVFQDCKDLETVVASGVTDVYKTSFSGCSKLKSVDLGSAKNIEGNVFEKCTSLTGVRMKEDGTPDLDEKGNYKYTLKDKEEEDEADPKNIINLSDSLVFIGNSCFSGSGLIAIQLPKKVIALTNNATNAGTVKVTNYNQTGSAFKDCANLERVEFLGNPQLIGKSAFENCASLTEIVAPDADYENNGLTVDGFFKDIIGIGDAAFKNTGIKRVVLNSIQSAGKEVFMGSAVEEVHINQGLRTASNKAAVWGTAMFKNCANLKGVEVDENGEPKIDPETNDYIYTVSLPADTYFGTNTFEGSGLIAFKFQSAITMIASATAASNPAYTSSTYLFKNCVDLKKVVFEGAKISKISGNVFVGCTSLETVEGLENVTYIGANAFDGTAIKSLNFNNNVTFGGSAFANCKQLESVTLSDKQTAIAASTFTFCYKLAKVNADDTHSVNLPDSITTIGLNAFCQAAISGKVKLPANLSSFGNGAFYNCDITEFEISSTAKNFSVKDGVLFNKDGNVLVSVPKCKQGKLDLSGVTEISSYALAYCDGITELVMPTALEKLNTAAFANFTFPEGTTFDFLNGLTSLPFNTFENAKGLGEVVLPDSIETLGSYVFKGSDVTKVTLSESLVSVPLEAFRDCTKLTEVVFGSKLEEISRNAFYGSGLISVTIPASVYEFGDDAFAYCESLETVVFEEGVTNIGLLSSTYIYSPSQEKDVRVLTAKEIFKGSAVKNVTFPSTLTVIGQSAFADTKIETVDLSKATALTTIGASAFANANIDTLELNNGALTSVGDYAFQNNPLTGELVLPETLTTIGKYAFADLGIETIDFSKATSLTTIGASAFANANIGTLELNNGALTSVGANAFQNNPLTGKLVIPETLTTIGKYAFAGKERTPVLDESGNETGEYDYTGCASLTEVVLNGTNIVLNEGAFANQYSLAKINLENVQKIYTLSLSYAGILNETGLELAFSSLTYVGVIVHKIDTTAGSETYGQVLSYGNGPLTGANVKKITFTNVDTYMGKLLHGFTELPEIVFPEGMTTLPDYFYAYSLVEEITIPANIEKLGANVFNLCVNLKKITFEEGSQLKETGNYAFAECVKLETLELPETLETVGIQSFKYDVSLKKLIIPESVTFGSTDNMSFMGWGADQTVYFRIAKDYRFRVLAYNFNDSSNANFVFGYKGN